MYQVLDYVAMVRDDVRMVPYVEALRRSISIDSVVLDIGTGIGVFALLAAKFGARRVYAIEPNPAIQIAIDLARINDCADKITFIEGLSTEVNLPEPVDVIISDLRGALPLSGNHLSSIIDAKQRFLKPGGKLIPQSDTLLAAVVAAPELYKPHEDGWAKDLFGLDLQRAQTFTTNSWRSGRVKEDQLLSGAANWVTLDYNSLTSPNAIGELQWTAVRDATAHGFVVWFDTVLNEEIGFSNSPGGGASVYGSAFFPWPNALEVSQGDQIQTELSATLVDDDYVWTWNTRIAHSGLSVRSTFKQSTFLSQPLTTSNLIQCSSDFVPEPNDETIADTFILNCIDATSTQGEIASRLQSAYPKIFSDWRDALTRVAQVTARYSKK